MKRSLKLRLHEWAADRIPWIQYPNVRAQTDSGGIRPLKFTHSMSMGKRVDLALFSIALLIVGVAVLVGVGAIALALLAGALS